MRMRAFVRFQSNGTKTRFRRSDENSRRMLSWAPERWISGRRCDAPQCTNESSAENCLVARAMVGPVVDRPLFLFFCQDHGDFGTLVDRYKSCVTSQREPVAGEV